MSDYETGGIPDRSYMPELPQPIEPPIPQYPKSGRYTQPPPIVGGEPQSVEAEFSPPLGRVKAALSAGAAALETPIPDRGKDQPPKHRAPESDKPTEPNLERSALLKELQAAVDRAVEAAPVVSFNEDNTHTTQDIDEARAAADFLSGLELDDVVDMIPDPDPPNTVRVTDPEQYPDLLRMSLRKSMDTWGDLKEKLSDEALEAVVTDYTQHEFAHGAAVADVPELDVRHGVTFTVHADDGSLYVWPHTSLSGQGTKAQILKFFGAPTDRSPVDNLASGHHTGHTHEHPE